MHSILLSCFDQRQECRDDLLEAVRRATREMKAFLTECVPAYTRSPWPIARVLDLRERRFVQLLHLLVHAANDAYAAAGKVRLPLLFSCSHVLLQIHASARPSLAWRVHSTYIAR